MKSELSYEECMSYIYGAKRFSDNTKLIRTKEVLRILGNPQDSLKIIHVAGTNGKGSVTAMISSVLMEAGYKVGMFTSPFLEEFEERIQINNCNIPKSDLAHYATIVRDALLTCEKNGFGEPNGFEIITSIMLKYFADQKVDYAVVEVGLGGRLDATNVVNPLVSVITSISYDHMNILGNTLSEIAGEKAGIIKNNIPVISINQEEEAAVVLKNTAEEKHSEITFVNKDSYRICESKRDDRCQLIKVNTKNNDYKVKLQLLGTYQSSNCALAINVLEKLKDMGADLNKQIVLEGLYKTKWKGRMEILKDNPLTIIDGAHNFDGIKNLKDSIKRYFSYKKLILILGILSDKESHKMVDEIKNIADYIIFTTPHSIRAEDPHELFKLIKDDNAEVIEDYKKAYEKARELSESNDLIVASGSLYMVGDMRKVINNY